jgi:ribosomal protein S18 acetylase RimI-like enzyme
VIAIRAAREDDIEGLAHVLAAAFDRVFRGVFGGRTEEGLRILLETLHDDWRQALVAEVDGRIVGTAFLLFAGERTPASRRDLVVRLLTSFGWLRAAWALFALTFLGESDPSATRGELHLLAVHPDHQRRGIGRALIESCFAEARRRGVRELRLWVAGNNGPARALYRACGFRRVMWLPLPWVGPLFGFWSGWRMAADVPREEGTRAGGTK